MDHPIDNLMKHTMEHLKGMIDVNTIVGAPVTSPDGTVIVPISKVSFGFVSGGSEFGNKTKESTEKSMDSSVCSSEFPFGGGSGAGVTLKPVAFLVVKDTHVRLLNLDGGGGYEKILESIPDMFNFVKDMFGGDDDKDPKHDKKKCKDKSREKKIHDKIIHDEKFCSVETDTK